MRIFLRSSLIALTGIAAAACGGASIPGLGNDDGGSSESSSESTNSVDTGEVLAATGSLVVGSVLNLVPVKDAAQGASLALNSTSYDETPQEFWFEDRSMETLQSANGILCFIGNLRYADESLVNQGPYLAMVPEAECFKEDEGKGDDKGGSGQGASQNKQEKLTPVIVLAEREDKKPLRVTVWFPPEEDEKGGGGPGMAQLEVKEGVSVTNPLGIFRLRWASGGTNGGRLESKIIDGKMVVELREGYSGDEDGGSFSGMSAMAALMDFNGNGEVTGGTFQTEFSNTWSHGSESGEESGNFKVAYTPDLMKRASADGEACLSLSDFNSVVHQYALFKEDGSPVDVASGFPIVYEDSKGEKYFGHAGYWGIWLPEEEVSIKSGMKVKKETHDGGSAEEFKVVKGAGRLYKNTKLSITLKEIIGIPLNAWSEDGEVRVVYNGSKFVQNGIRGDEGNYEDTKEKEYQLNDWNDFWAEGFGSVTITKDGSKTNVVVTTRDDVTARAKDMQLYCVSQCPQGAVSEEDLYGSHEEEFDGNPTVYNFDASDLALKYGSSTVKVDGGEGMYYNSSPLLTKAAYDDLASELTSSPHKIWNASTFYTWETGSDPWSRFTGLKDKDNKWVRFDPPLRIEYKHTAENDRDGGSDAVGRKFLLEYGGFGQLWGIPGNESEDKGWMPLFSLADGATVGDKNYKVKALSGSLLPKELDAATCAALDPSAAPALPGEIGEMLVEVPSPVEFGDLSVTVSKGELVGE